MSRIAVIGAGYVGLTTAVCLSHLGHTVHCADVLADRVALLEQGQLPLVEEGLAGLLQQGIAAGSLQFSTDNVEAVTQAEFTFLCVPTPQQQDGRADLQYIERVAGEIGGHLAAESVVINKSTVPVGSARVVERALGRPDVAVVSNPEFLREGSAVHDFLHPDRIVIGADDEATAIRVAALFVRIGAPLLVTDPASAEMVKYASNAFLATKVSFVNAIATLCEAVGADVRQVVLGMGYDRRIGSEFLRPGPGWGGSCFPKDTSALVHIAEDAGYDFGLLKGVIAVNDDQAERTIAKAIGLAGGSIDGKVVALWGLTFKARTDDLRGSPAVAIARRLSAQGARVQAYDPTVGHPLEGMEVCADAYAACVGASVLVVATEWDELRWLDFAKVGDVMETRAVLDARNLLEPAMLRRLGFVYQGIGVA
ncbi:MAG: UDP-glucose dehydrogenase family protein [Candidatus Dormibacteria bacterium]